MTSKPAAKRRRAEVQGVAKARWLRAIAGGMAVLLGLELAMGFLVFFDQPAQSVSAGSCPNLELNASGQVRDRGLMSCNNLVDQNIRGSRTDMIRDSFNRR